MHPSYQPIHSTTLSTLDLPQAIFLTHPLYHLHPLTHPPSPCHSPTFTLSFTHLHPVVHPVIHPPSPSPSPCHSPTFTLSFTHPINPLSFTPTHLYPLNPWPTPGHEILQERSNYVLGLIGSLAQLCGASGKYHRVTEPAKEVG